jgi:hypothetical protein
VPEEGGRTENSAGRSEHATDHGRADIVRSVGEVAAPLLAGFSFATIFVVSGETSHLLLPGEAIVALTLATVILIAAVQLAKYRGENQPPVSGSSRLFSLSSDKDYEKWTVRCYHVGIVALLAGFGFALAPQYQPGGLYIFRWVASVVAFLACSIELFVYVRRALCKTRS